MDHPAPKTKFRLALVLLAMALMILLATGCSGGNASSDSPASEAGDAPVDNHAGEVEYSWSGLTFYLDEVYGDGWGESASQYVTDVGSGLSCVLYSEAHIPITDEQAHSVEDVLGRSISDVGYPYFVKNLGDLSFHIFIYRNGETQSPEHYDEAAPMPAFSGFDVKISLANDCTALDSREAGTITYTLFEQNASTKYYVMGHDSDTGYGFVVRVGHFPYATETIDLEKEFLRPVAEEVYASAVFDPSKVTFDSLATEPSVPSPSTSGNQSSSRTEAPAYDKDELIVDTDGKMVYHVQAIDNTIHFTGEYTGTGNFIVQVRNDNQELDTLVCNEIGDWKLDSSAKVTKGLHYYISIEWNNGSWNATWTGTGGA